MMNLAPTRSAWAHIRIAFSFFLLPVFVFALSQVTSVHFLNTTLAFIVWHFFIYPASNGYNSYFDRDEDSIALLAKPPVVDKSLYYFSLFLDLIGIALAFWVSIQFAVAVFLYGLLSKLYSHPLTRLKKYPVISFLIVFIFQGAFVYWSSYQAISGELPVTKELFIAGVICSCLIGASYPLTQVYQHAEDARRGDKTLSLILGVRHSFLFSAILFALGLGLILIYWLRLDQLSNFWLFLVYSFPVAYFFVRWYLKVLSNEKEANFKNMTQMTWISSCMMLLYFVTLLLCK